MNQPIKLETQILDLVLSDQYHPLKPKAIAKKLGLLDEEREVKRTIKRLIKKGKLAYGPKHLVIRSHVKPEANNQSKSKVVRKTDEIIGKFRRVAAGFGFVTPLKSTATDRSDDIFIPKTKTDDAADLDIVKIRVSKRNNGRDNRVTGRVIEVMERNTHRFVGTYREQGGFGFVVVDGGVFESGILVGDAGAKNCRVDDKVVIEMAHFPSLTQDGEGVIVEVLGDRGQPGVDTLSVMRQFDLPDEFPEKVLDDARRQAEAFDEKITDNRTDFTKKTVITIDPKTARDFDDAISLEKLENGHWELGVHIADVSHFVPPRSDLDNEAYHRATSVYLPDRVIPMLPEIISNNLASLQPNRLRYCMTALIEFTDLGIPVRTELHRGAISSGHRFNYEEIDDYLANDRPWKKKLTPAVFELVRNMHTLAMKLRNRRMTAGAINLILPEVKIDLDDDGRVAGAHTVDNTESHQVIEEFMLAANEAVAQRLFDEHLYYLRRVHPHPSEVKLNELTEFVRQLGIDCDSLKSRFEVKRVIEESEHTPQQHAIHYAVLRSMQKAIYSPEEIGHYALNSNNYCHFTSPIRRYPDLIIHRMVGDLVDGKKPESNFERLAMLGKHCSDQEKRAADAERELIKLKLLNFMVDKVGHKMTAVITGVEAFGVFAQGIEIPAEGMIPIANLPADTYQYDRGTRTLTGFKEGNEYRLGDQIQVSVAVVEPDLRTLEFEIVGIKPTRDNAAQRSKSARPDEKSSSPRSATRQESSTSRQTSSTNRPERATTRRESSKPQQGKSKSRQNGSSSRRESSTSRRESSTSRREGSTSRREGSTSRENDSSTKKPERSRSDWESKRASGPQQGQKKKRRTRDSDQQASGAGRKSKKKSASKTTAAKSKSADSKPDKRTKSKPAKRTKSKTTKRAKTKTTQSKSKSRKRK